MSDEEGTIIKSKIKCLGCKTIRRLDQFDIKDGIRKRTCMECYKVRKTRREKVEKMMEDATSEGLPDILSMDKLFCGTLETFISGIFILPEDFDEIELMGLGDKLFNLISEEYNGLTFNRRPYYTLNKKRRIIYIKLKEWSRVCCDGDADNDLLLILAEEIVNKIKEKANKLRIKINYDYDKNELSKKLIELGSI